MEHDMKELAEGIRQIIEGKGDPGMAKARDERRKKLHVQVQEHLRQAIDGLERDLKGMKAKPDIWFAMAVIEDLELPAKKIRDIDAEYKRIGKD